MTPVERQRNDNKLLFAVATLVTAGALVIVLLAGMTGESDSPQHEGVRAAATPRAMPSAPLVAEPAMTASFERVEETTFEEPDVTEPESSVDPDANFIAEGVASYEAREFERAAAYFTAEIDARPQRAWPYYMLGLSLWKSGELDPAAVAMERSAQLDSTSIKSFVNLSRIENDRGAFELALDAALAARRIDDGDASASFLEGRSLLNLGRTEDAVLALERSIEIDPDNGYVQNMLGLALLGQERAGEALIPLVRAAELRPKVAYIHNNLGMAYELTGDAVAALAAYRRAVDSDTGHENSVINLARLEPTVPSGASDPLPAPAPALAEVVEVATVATGDSQPF